MTEKPIDAQAFREAADDCLTTDPDTLEGAGYNYTASVLRRNATLLLAAAEQREQLEAERLVVDVITEKQRQQIATLTAERDEARDDRDTLRAALTSLTLTDKHDAVAAACTVLQKLHDARHERDEARTLLADFKLHLT